jgi:DNA-binding Lrp family transcriptional regulator
MGTSKQQKENSFWYDQHLLELVQSGAMQVNELAHELAMEPRSAGRRLDRLREAGVIVKTVEVLDREKVGIRFEDLLLVKLRPESSLTEFVLPLEGGKGVYQVRRLRGEFHLELRLATPDAETRQQLLDQISETALEVKVLEVGDVIINEGLPIFSLPELPPLTTEP